MGEDFAKLPDDLLRPENDMACDHLLGKMVPNILLPSTSGSSLDACTPDAKFVIMYFFPMMAVPEKKLPTGWNMIPGARGCTPQNIAISKHKDDLSKFGATPIGISTQPIEELSKLSPIRGFSQVMLSDDSLKFQENLGIPTFQVENNTMYKRLTLILKKSKVIKVFYPVFPLTNTFLRFWNG